MNRRACDTADTGAHRHAERDRPFRSKRVALLLAGLLGISVMAAAAAASAPGDTGAAYGPRLEGFG